MKKMLLATALAIFITGCAQQTFFTADKPAAVAPKETITHHFLRFWNWAENCRCSQNLWRRRKCCTKTETQQTFVNGLLRFYTDIILRWKRVCIAHNNCMSCPSIWATLSALLINILLEFLPVVFA